MNENSLEANAVAQSVAKSIKEKIAGCVKKAGPLTGERIGELLDIEPSTLGPRLAEMKGVSLGHNITIVRTGDTLKTKGDVSSDVLIHVSKATQTQIEAHIQWVKGEREKKAQDFRNWIEKLKTAPLPQAAQEIGR